MEENIVYDLIGDWQQTLNNNTHFKLGVEENNLQDPGRHYIYIYIYIYINSIDIPYTKRNN